MPQIEISDEDLSFLKNLAHEIDSQDNAATAHPYYIVVRTSRQIILPQGMDLERRYITMKMVTIQPLLYTNRSKRLLRLSAAMGMPTFKNAWMRS